METVIPHVTGLHFERQTTDSLIQAMEHFETEHYNPVVIQAHARAFDTIEFKRRFSAFVDLCIEAKRTGRPWTEIARQGKLGRKIHRVQKIA